MSRATDLHAAVGSFTGEIGAKEAGRILRALGSFGWDEIRRWKVWGDKPEPWPPDERTRMQRARRADRRWVRDILASDAFHRCYAALPEPKLPEARELLVQLGGLRGMIVLNKAGNLDPHGHARMFDHAENIAELRSLAMRFPDKQREWIRETADRVERDLRTTLYCDPYWQTAPTELIGTGGRAGDGAAAFRGWMIRSAAQHVPPETHNRYACIAELLTACGMRMRPDAVRATLDSWDRKKR